MRTVRTTGEFMDAVRGGVLAIRLDGHIEVPEPLNMAEHVGNSSHFSLTSSGGWTGGALYRGFDGPEAVLRFPRYHTDRERHWELRMRGVNFDPNAHLYPDAGPALDVELMQLSVMEDMRFVGFPGKPFVFGSGPDGNVNACQFRDFWLMDNMAAGELLEASDFIWRGGNMERGAGLEVRGPDRGKENTYPAPGRIEDVHMEFSSIEVTGVDDLHWVNKYRYWSDIRFTDCRRLYPEWWRGFAPFSDTYIDGLLRHSGPRQAPGATA